MRGVPVEIKPGDQYGDLTVIRDLPREGKSRRILCRCSCGSQTAVLLSNLRHRTTPTRSCGTCGAGRDWQETCVRRMLAAAASEAGYRLEIWSLRRVEGPG